MSLPKYKCLICEHDFKSPSHLKRHQEKKKKCVKKEISKQQDTTHKNNSKQDSKQDNDGNINSKIFQDFINKDSNIPIVMHLLKD